MNRRTTLSNVLLATVLVALGACGDKSQPAKPAPSSGSSPAPQAKAVNDPLSVMADVETQKWVKTAVLATSEFREVLRVPAAASVDETRVARIGSSVTGRVTELKGVVGQNVTRGDTLAVLNSTELSNAQLGFLKAFSAKMLAERAAQRAKQLFEADVIGAAELQRRETELSQAEAEMSAAHDQLVVLGMSEKAIAKLEQARTVNSQSVIVSSIAGTIIERNVSPGQVVQPADAVFTVADLSRLWIQAEIPEKQSELVKVGDVVNVQIPALGNKDIEGRIVFVSSTVNPETRTVTARTEVANPDRAIRPAMLATMLIQDRPQQRALLPVNAVIREGNRDYVFASKGDNKYTLTAVFLGPETNGMRPILEGPPTGTTVVTEGAFHLNNERKLNLQ